MSMSPAGEDIFIQPQHRRAYKGERTVAKLHIAYRGPQNDCFHPQQ